MSGAEIVGGENGKAVHSTVKGRTRSRIHRTRQHIIIDILEASLTTKKKMRIMYRANLNFDQFRRHFQELLQKGFIEELDDGNGKPAYRISERGRTLLGALREAEDLFNSDNQ